MGNVGSNAAVENSLATIGALLWSLQLVPQILKSHRHKDTQGLSIIMLAIWILSASFLGAFLILEHSSLPLIIQPQAFTITGSIAFAQCLYYNGDSIWTKGRSIAVAFGGIVGVGVLELGMIWVGQRSEGVTFALGVGSAVLIVGGLVPQYLEIYKYKAVIGISLLFLLVDIFGGFFSCLSLVFAPKFDFLASLSYGAVAILELGVILLALLLNPSHRRREIEKALTMEQSGENTARSSFADDEEREEDFETAGEEEEGESGRNIGGEERRRDLERGVRGRVEIEDEMPLLK